MIFSKGRGRRKFVAVFFLLLMVESLFHPAITYALTTGPHQPEYTSYEEPGATDMVNLLTGDFSFSLPILEVPGPEGSFSVPLTYNAGVGPEQEASWVGLGWTLNVGAITREINQYPDDASGEIQAVHMNDGTGIRGWTSAALGFGQMGWNNVQGHYGSLSLFGIYNASYNQSGVTSIGEFGVNVGARGGNIKGRLHFDDTQFANALMTVASVGLAEADALKAGETAGTGTAKALATQALVQAALSLAFPSHTPGNPSGYWQYTGTHKQRLLHKDFWKWLDQTRYDRMYGILNLHNGSASPDKTIPLATLQINSGAATSFPAYSLDSDNTGVASDISYYLPPNTAFKDATSSGTLAQDNFVVRAPGLSGGIHPYRYEVGSVSLPQAMTSDNLRGLAVPYKSYKVPFLYDGSLSSSYLYHNGNVASQNNPNGLGFNFGLSFSVDYSADTRGITKATVSDNIFDPSQRMRADLPASNELAQANHIEWMSNREIMQQSGGFANGYMDYFSGSDPKRASFRQQFDYTYQRTFHVVSVPDEVSVKKSFVSTGNLTLNGDEALTFTDQESVSLTATAYSTSSDMEQLNNGTVLPAAVSKVTAQSGNLIVPNRLILQVPQTWSSYNTKYLDIQIVAQSNGKSLDGIGGFSITAANGLTYHFALPVHDYNYYSYLENTSDHTKNSSFTRDVPFANTWLLTGITGSDFVDRGGTNNAANGVIDQNDWGYWVKFNYGRHTWNYNWQIPYAGSAGMLMSYDNSTKTYSNGSKELYYLNSIETRSHIALFIKDSRQDNYDAGMATAGSLRLREIALLRKNDYQTLCSTYSMTPDASTTNDNWLYSSFYVDGSPNLAPGQFIASNALKRIRFNQTYDLCPGTPNSNASNQGKLTLTSLSIMGKNNAAVIPNYKFSYGNNPSYSSVAWDGWGMYNAYATADYNNHMASDSDSDASSWSLSQITTPLGSTINVNYERDQYASVSHQYLNLSTYHFANSATVCSTNCPYSGTSVLNGVDNIAAFKVNDQILVSGSASGSCNGTAVSQTIHAQAFTIKSISGNSITLDRAFGTNYVLQCSQNLSLTYSGTIQLSSGRGGDLRVASILLQDQGKQYKTRYLYTMGDGSSSGVVAQEPSYSRATSFQPNGITTTTTPIDFNVYPDYPFTPVMYSKVTVLNGALTSDTDFTTRTIYQFETPNFYTQYNYLSNVTSVGWNKTVDNEITDYTAKIGVLNSTETQDATGHQVSLTTFTYGNTMNNPGGVNNFQGCFSYGTIMHDWFTYPTQGLDFQEFKMTRTSLIKFPWTLQSVTTTKDGYTSETDNIAWDLYSGQVVQKNDISADGVSTTSVIKPAYLYYPQMGPKALGSSNKNMLSQTGGEYVYRVYSTADCPPNARCAPNSKLLSAEVTTWKSDWGNYRYLSSSNSYVEDGNEPGTNPAVWRKNKSYVYNGSYNSDQDGTMVFDVPGNEFDYSGATGNQGWQQTSEIGRYDHYSMPLETLNPISKINSATKTDFAGKSILASVSNANYFEFAYSSAEDLDATSGYFGGEVAVGSGTIATSSHTGGSSLSLNATGAYGFIYTVPSDKVGQLRTNHTYRVSAWTNSTNGRVYYKLNGTETVSAAPVASVANATTGQTWYQVNMEIPIPSGATISSFEAGVKSASGTVLFDDFRFQPVDAGMTTNVYDPATGALTFVLDNQNMFTQYVYNDQGQLTKTYRESFAYGIKLISENRINYRRFLVNP